MSHLKESLSALEASTKPKEKDVQENANQKKKAESKARKKAAGAQNTGPRLSDAKLRKDLSALQTKVEKDTDFARFKRRLKDLEKLGIFH